jgi:hypothetical protein
MTEQRVEALVGHRQTRAIIEIGLIEPEGAVRFQVDKLFQDQSGKLRLSIWRKPHQFVFTRIHPKSGVVSECRIEQAERVGKVQFLVNPEIVAGSDRKRRRRPFANPVHHQNGGVLKRRRIERRRGMGKMVLSEQNARWIEIGRYFCELAGEPFFLKQLFAQPDRDRHLKGPQSPRGERDIGLQQPLELQKRLVIENDGVEIGKTAARLFQAIFDRGERKARIVLFPAEPFFLGRGDDRSVCDKRGGAVVVQRRDAENAHRRSEQGIDERRDGAALCQNEKPSEDNHHKHDRQEPKLLSRPHETPEFVEERHFNFL